jgi:hypothetical protein
MAGGLGISNYFELRIADCGFVGSRFTVHGSSSFSIHNSQFTIDNFYGAADRLQRQKFILRRRKAVCFVVSFAASARMPPTHERIVSSQERLLRLAYHD